MKKNDILSNMKTTSTIFIVIMLFMFGSGILMAQTTVTIYSLADNSPDEFAPTINRGTCDRVYLTGGAGSIERGLFKFDLSSIPTGATITSGTLYLYRILGTGSGNVNVHRITSDWTEGTGSCIGTAGMVSNWNQRTSGTNWTTSGGDYNSTVEATTNVPATTYTTNSWNVQNLIQGWVNSSYPNYGLLIKETDESAYNQMTFATREYSGTANDARLVITYITSPTTKTWTGSISTDWGTAGNWSPSSVPSFGDTAIVPTIPSGGRFPVLSGSNYYLDVLDIQSGASVTQNDDFLILDDIIIRGGNPSATLIQNAGSFYIHRDWINNGTFISNGGLVLFDGTGTSESDFTGYNQFTDLFIQEQPKFDNYPASLIIIKGTFTSNSALFNPSANATFLFNGSGDQNITKSISGDKARFGNFQVNKTTGNVILKTYVDINGDAAIDNGTLDTEANLLRQNTSGGVLSLSKNSLLKTSGSNTFPSGFTSIELATSSTVEFYGSNQILPSAEYGNLVLSGSGTKTFAAGTTGIAGSLSLNGSVSVNTITNSSNINYNSASNQNVAAIDYYDLTLSNAGTKYFAAGTVGIGGDLSINDLALADAVTLNDTVKFFGTGTITELAPKLRITNLPIIDASFLNDTDKYFSKSLKARYGFINKNMIITGDGSVTAMTNILVTNTLIIVPSAALNMNNYILTVNGQLLNNGNFISTNPSGCMSFYSKSSGDYNQLSSWANDSYSGTAANRLPGEVNNDVLIIGNSKTLGLTSNVSNLGTVRVDSSGTFNPLSFIINGTGQFDLRKDGNLIITLPDGINSISGNIQTAIQLFNTSANFEFSGTTPQVTGTGFPSSVSNLIINNLGGVILSNSTGLTGSLTLSQGNLILDNNNLTLSPTSTIMGTPSSTNMIITNGNGQLRKEFTSTCSFTFPVGDNTGTAEYSPISLDFISGTFSSAYAGVNVVNAKHPQNASSINFIKRYWRVSSNGISSFSCNVTCKYTDSDIQSSAIEASIYGGKYNGSNWTLLNPANVTMNELTGSVNSFSDFTGGESNALPVELIAFAASVINNSVLLSWKTATEVNNYGFEIERSSYSNIWTKIGFVNGRGNSNSDRKYSFNDENVNNGNYFYRLKQIDADGAFSYSNVVSVTVDNKPNSFALNQNYPNPFNPTTKIRWQSPVSGWQSLKVYDILGNEVATLVNEFREAGSYEIDFGASQLTSGVYIYKISAGNFSDTKKMILSK